MSPNRADAIEDESLAALRSLLENEVHPLHSCGRAYLSNLTKWRDDVLSSRGGRDRCDTSAAETARAAPTAAGTAGRAMTPHRAVAAASPSVDRDDGPGRAAALLRENEAHARPSSIESEKKMPPRVVVAASPDRNPDILLDWRARIVEWYFDFVHHRDFHHNTALVALSYLDAYSMSVCFPEEFSLLATERSDHRRSANNDDDASSIAPSPNKKRKTGQHRHHQHEDYFWEYVENQSRQHDDDVRGLDEDHYKLAAISCLYLACKIYQSAPVMYSSSDFADLCRRKYSQEQIEDMESDVLRVLGFRVHTPTALRFVQEMMPLLIANRSPAGAGGRDSFAFDSSPWTPQDDIEKDIYSDASMFATLASYCDAAKFHPIMSASPSQIALAAIVESAERTFRREKLLLRQNAFLERLFDGRLQAVPYDREVRAIQECLVDLKRLNNLKDDTIPREGSPVTVVAESSSPGAATEAPPSSASEDKENICVEPNNRKLDKPATNPAGPSCAAIHRAVVSQSRSRRSSVSLEKKSNRCIEGRKHRMWERADQCALAAGAASRFSYEQDMHRSRCM